MNLDFKVFKYSWKNREHHAKFWGVGQKCPKICNIGTNMYLIKIMTKQLPILKYWEFIFSASRINDFAFKF